MVDVIMKDLTLAFFKRIEEVFGWLKTVAGLRKTRLIGQARLAGQVLLATATYNLIRMGAIGGWWRGAHV